MINEKRELKELGGFRLINILEGEEDEKIKIFSTLEMIEYCLEHDAKSMIFQSIQSTTGNEFHYLSFDSKGILINSINKEDLNKKYAIEIKTTKFKNALDTKFKKESLWVRGRVSEGASPYVTLDDTIDWINKFDNKDDYLINEIYHINDNGCKKVLAERIK